MFLYNNELSMKLKRLCFLLGIAALYTLSSCDGTRSSFEFKHSDQGLELLDAGNPLFFYQREPKSPDGQYLFNNYIHPLYTPEGIVLTEEFPADHPYHRGVFWAWHQIFIDDKRVGNSWIMQDISQNVRDVQTRIQNSMARMDIDVFWQSSHLKSEKPFVHEHTTILVHPMVDGVRKIDFEISLEGLIPGVSIGGAADDKGYGGFCIRMKLPEDITFTSTEGVVIPKSLQIESGAWMDFSASFGGDGNRAGLVIICHPTTPNYPARWILRQRRSMQNIVYPGRYRTELPVNQPVVLRYRTLLYEGNRSDIDFNRLKTEYDQFVYPQTGIQIIN